MSELVRIHNPVAQPVIYTARGHQLDGFTGTNTDPDEPVTARLLEKGRIIIVPKPTPPEIPSRPTIPKAKKPTTGKEEN